MTMYAPWSVPGFAEIRELGAGAQGRVVLARPDGTDVHVAIKYLTSADDRALAAFRREAETLAGVDDPHVVRLHRYVEGPDGAAIVMAAVDGVALRDLLEGAAPLAPEAALTVLKGSLLGLAAAHRVGVVHRDYKPANVVVRPDGVSTLIDFGVAVLAGERSRSGTPAYMAPEQWEGAPASPATDVYAATCVFFECVTGSKPYSGSTLEQVRMQHLAAPVPGTAPAPVLPLLTSGLAKDPAHRPADAAAFVAVLETVAAGAYGPDWEQRGVRALAVAAAALTGAVPLALLGVLRPDAAPSGAPSAAEASAHAAGGALGKAGASKVAIGAAAVGTAAIVTAGVLVVRDAGGTTDQARPTTSPRPSVTATTVGGTSGGTLTGGTGRWQMNNTLTLSPARAAPGTRVTVRVVTRMTGRAFDGLGVKLGSGHDRLSLYAAPPATPGSPPTGAPVRVPTTIRPIGGDTMVYTATIPAGTRLSPGRYVVSPWIPAGISEVRLGKGRDWQPSTSVPGFRSTVTLPVITILP